MVRVECSKQFGRQEHEGIISFGVWSETDLGGGRVGRIGYVLVGPQAALYSRFLVRSPRRRVLACFNPLWPNLNLAVA